MIQFGSILAVMWLYRERNRLGGARAAVADPEARRFALMMVVAFVPAVLAGLLLADFVGSVYESPDRFGWAFIIGGVVMLRRTLFRRPLVIDADQTPCRARSASACSDAGAGSGRVAVRARRSSADC